MEGKALIKFEDIISKGLAYILPEYIENKGNVTKAASIEGDIIIEEKSIKSALKTVAKYYGADIKALRLKYGKIIGRKNTVPIPLAPELILVPFKIRKPMISWDGTIGYVSYRQIKGIIGDHNINESIITLRCGLDVRCLNKKTTAERHIRDAEIVYKSYISLYGIKEKQAIIFKEIQSTYSQPATRGDIAILAKEIIDLKEKLKV